jgi:uncharacterized protein YjbJ (UPF0337 family)
MARRLLLSPGANTSDNIQRGDESMNNDRLQGNWKQFKGKVREKWGKLTDDQLDVINGRREILAGKIQEMYAVSKDEAERQIKDWERTIKVADAQDYEEDVEARANARR